MSTQRNENEPFIDPEWRRRADELLRAYLDPGDDMTWASYHDELEGIPDAPADSARVRAILNEPGLGAIGSEIARSRACPRGIVRANELGRQ